MTNLEKPSPCKADFYALWCDECSVHPSDCPLRAAARPAQEPVAWQWRFKTQGHWSKWILLEPDGLSAFRELQGHHLESGHCELQALYAAPLSLTGENEK